jgi:hypothetical protein
MRLFKHSILLLTVLIAGTFANNSYGQCPKRSKKRMKKLHKMAMEDYNQMEFASARKTLEDGISLARREGCDEELIYANMLVDLGIMYITDPDNPDESRGKLRFKKALKVNPCAKINPDLSTPRLVKILKKVRKKLGVKCVAGKTPKVKDPKDPKDPKIDKPTDEDPEDTGEEPQSIEHSTPDEAVIGKKLTIRCRAPKSKLDKVMLYYRKPGQSSYTAKKMKNYSGFAFKAVISKKYIKGSIFQYYIAALNAAGNPIMANGNSGAPNIISLIKGKSDDSDPDEDPLGNKTKNGKKDIPKPGEFKKFHVWLGFRYTMGYVSDTMCSISDNPAPIGDCAGYQVENPGFAAGEIGAEIGVFYFTSNKLAVGLSLRPGTVTSGVSDAAATGFAGLGKLLFYPMGTTGTFKPYMGGILGGGMFWHVVNDVGPNGESDTFKHGYVALGGSLGFLVGSPTVSFYVNVDAMGIFPEQSTIHVEFTTGLAIGF